jgi:hypothetical protein
VQTFRSMGALEGAVTSDCGSPGWCLRGADPFLLAVVSNFQVHNSFPSLLLEWAVPACFMLIT